MRMSRGWERLRGWSGLAIVLAAVALAYSPALGNEFAYDDVFVARAVTPDGRANPMVAELRPIGTYLTTSYWRGAGQERVNSTPLYRPLTVWTFALTHAVAPGGADGKGEAFPHHLFNVLLQLLNTALVFSLARRLAGPRSAGPVCAAAVFGLAAIHSEAVASLVGRADLLAFAFGAAALRAFLGYLDGRGPGGLSLAALSSVLLWLGFLAKESALGWWPYLACVALAVGWHEKVGRRVTGRALLAATAIGVVPVIAWALLRSAACADTPASGPTAYLANPLPRMELGPRLLAAAAIQGYAALTTLLPWDLACDYGPRVFPFAEPESLARAADTPTDILRLVLARSYLVVWLAILVPTLLGARRWPLLFLAGTAFVGLGMATSNLLVPIGTVWAERLAYLPSLALPWVVLFVAETIRRRHLPWVLAGLVYVLHNGVLAFRRAGDWKNDQTLFTNDVETRPRSLFLRLQAAIAAQRRNDWPEQIRHLNAAIADEPRWIRPYIELAAGTVQRATQNAPSGAEERARYLEQKLREAAEILRHGLRATIFEPDEPPMLWMNLGAVLSRLGQKGEARVWFDKVLHADPTNRVRRHQVLINAATGLDDADLVAILAEGEHAAPTDPLWAMHRGLRDARLGSWHAARSRLETSLPRVVLRDSNVQRAWLVLAECLRRDGDAARAHSVLQRIAADPTFLPQFRQAARAALGH